MPELESDVVVFGEFELDKATRQLRHLGNPVALQPRVLDLLEFLIRHRSRAVNKDEIQEAVWSGTIVSETALTRAIMKARRAVGDSADRQGVIRTVHGHGYQFVALVETSNKAHANDVASGSVEESGRSAEAKSVSEQSVRTGSPTGLLPRESAKSPPLRAGWLVAAGALAILIVALAVTWITRPSSAPGELKVAVLPVLNVSESDELDWVKLGLLGFANDLLQSSTELAVVPSSELVKYAESRPGPLSIDSSEIIPLFSDLAHAFGATHVVASEIQSTVGGLRLTYSLFDRHGEINRSTMVSEQSTELIRGMVQEISSTLTKSRYLPTQAGNGDPFISEAYARGVSYALKGQCADAHPLFQIVLDRTADNFNARFAKADCERILGRPDDAERELLNLLEALKQSDQVSLRALVLGRLGTVSHVTGRLDEAQTYLAQGLEEARLSGDYDAMGRLFNSQALLAKDRQDNQKARELLGQAALAYRDAGRKILPGQIHSALANLSMSDGNWSQAEEHLNDALASFRTFGDRRREAMMINNYGYLRRRQGRMEEAEALHKQSMEIRRDIGDQVGQARIMSMLSAIYRNQHRYEEARDIALEAIEITSQAKDRLFTATSYAQLASAEDALGRRAASREAYEQALQLFIEIEDDLRSAQVELRLARLDLDEQNTAAARERTESVMIGAQERQQHELIIEALEISGDIAVEEQLPEDAERFYEQALAYIGQHNFNQRQANLWVKLGDLYLAADRTGEAESLLGLLVAGEETAASKKFHARVTFYKGEAARAAELLLSAKTLDTHSWSDDDQLSLERYQQAAREPLN